MTDTEYLMKGPTMAPDFAAMRSEPPRFMYAGSQGPVVEAVINFLREWAARARRNDVRLPTGDFYGDEACGLMRIYQERNGLEPTGYLNGPTIDWTTQNEFDYPATAKRYGTRGVTRFASKNGSFVYWSTGTEATGNPEQARARFREASSRQR